MIPVSSGTGFCIAEGNYVLTNYHVIRHAKEFQVQLNGEAEMYRAKLIATSESRDMALLKIELPAGRKLAPVPLMAQELKIGEDVCALGWSGEMSRSLHATLSKGVVSTLPADDDNGVFIVTDCTINAGNGGGPVCGYHGGVGGMVTRNSQITSPERNYGMAIPVGRLRKFLAETLPKDAKMPPAQEAEASSMKLSDLAEKIAPGVVYIENIQEIRAPRHGPEQDAEQDPGE